MDMDAFRQRAKLADDQVASLEATLKSLVKSKCSKYRYELVYYELKNRGNFARLLFAEAGIAYNEITNRNQVLTHFKCANTQSAENQNRLWCDLFAPPAVLRHPLDPNDKDIVAVSQTEAIVGFLATEFNLRPSTLENHYTAQMLVANSNDILADIFNHRQDSYEDLNAFYTNRIQRWMDILQKPLTIKPGQKFYFDDRCLAVDLAVFNICDGLLEIMDDRKKELFIDTHPILYEHYTRIASRKAIKAMLDSQHKKKWTWWPAFYDFPACKDRLNGRDASSAAKGSEEKKDEPLAGGWKEAEKEEMNAAAQAVKQQVEQQAASANQAKFTAFEVVSGSKQVVAGMNFKIKVRVGEKRFIEMVVYRSLPPVGYELKSVDFSGDGGRPGGWKKAEKQEMMEAANAVKSEVQKACGDDEKFSCYEAISGSKQVVAGINYQIRVKVGQNRYAQMLVFRSLPPVKYELKSVVFVDETAKPRALGGWGKAAETDELTAAANAVKSEVEQQAKHMGKSMKCYQVEEGRKQVVAGMNFKIKIKIDLNSHCEITVYRSLPPIQYE
eukprot:CAMPEP_0197033872 /NCGR_PEP_ID=MMETSP1384-20130603/12158_1 /TAXON_ID=29189 /ORGANISM="Ammonia sp." /LENGTH=555 /DNA_ID=CAMNT_0042463735 /DNA_START=8 /DNA_END=1672 /DNA_ORIENTATION=+